MNCYDTLVTDGTSWPYVNLEVIVLAHIALLSNSLLFPKIYETVVWCYLQEPVIDHCGRGEIENIWEKRRKAGKQGWWL